MMALTGTATDRWHSHQSPPSPTYQSLPLGSDSDVWRPVDVTSVRGYDCFHYRNGERRITLNQMNHSNQSTKIH